MNTPLSNEEIFAKLLLIIEQQHHLGTSQISMQSVLADIGLDSLAIAELLFSIEDEFQISLGELEAQDVPSTCAELIQLIQSQLAKK